ncbi:hypothetical protein ACHAWF_001230 [Thalassiosira exigua]
MDRSSLAMSVQSVLLAVIAIAASFAIGADAFTTSPSRVATPLSKIATRPWASIRNASLARTAPSATSHSCLNSLRNDEDVEGYAVSGPSLYSPLDRPLLAVVDVMSLIVFAAIGKSSHGEDGTLNLLGVLITAFPFVTAWLATSPITGVYSPDEREDNMVASTIAKVGKGWILAVPLGVVLRGVIRGYAPPVPFIVVTLISTLVIVAGARIIFNVVEDFFVELVN